MRKAALLAALLAFIAVPAVAQEPDHLERLAGLCSDEAGSVVGRYAGRVLWTTDGQLSGMMRRDEAGETGGALDIAAARGGSAPTSITIPRQKPIAEGEGWLLRSSAVLASADDVAGAETALLCEVQNASATDG